MRARLAAIAALLFGSGFAALVYQTVWQKYFRLVFGASSEASATVLGIFLGGLGLGGILLGRRAEKHERPLEFYGNLELAIAGLAAVSPFEVAALTKIYALTGGSESLGLPAATALRILIAGLVILPPAFLMGGTLPAAARAAISNEDGGRRALARLYALNTSGAVLGALTGPLFLFGSLGTRLTLWLAVGLNLLVGMGARVLSRQQANILQPATTNEVRTSGDQGPSQSLTYTLAAVVGFVFLFMELVWFRMLSPLLGGSSITFGLILAVALGGIGWGGWIYSQRDVGREARFSTLAMTLALEAVCLALPFAWGDDLALVTAHLRAMANLGTGMLYAGWVIVAAIVVLPASIVAGYQFPLLFSLLGRGREGVAKQVGLAYAFNTLGTLLGSFLGGFVLLPWLGATLSWRLCGALLLLAAFATACSCWREFRKSRPALSFFASAVGAALLLSMQGPGDIWRHTPIGAGRVKLDTSDLNELREWRFKRSRLLAFEKDGVEAALGVEISNGVTFLVNGKSDGSVVEDSGTQIMLGLIPAALHENAKRAFVVGLGTGTTAGMLGLVPTIEHVDVAEIEPAIIKVAEMASLANGDVLQNPKVKLQWGDARELLLAKSAPYDLIVSEPSNPYRAGVASLFTQEFYQLAASRLNKDGIFVQWIQGYEIDAFTISTALRTLRSVLPSVSLWSSQSGDFLLIGRRKTTPINMDKLRARLLQEPFQQWVPRSRFVSSAEAFAAQQLIPAQKVDLLLELVEGTVNHDDLNVMEYRFASLVGVDSPLPEDLRALVLKENLRPHMVGQYDQDLVLASRQRLMPSFEWQASPRAQSTTMGCMGNFEQAFKLWPSDEVASDVVEKWVLSNHYATRADESARPLADEIRKAGFVAEAAQILSLLAENQAQVAAAEEHLLQAIRLLRDEALPLCTTAELVLHAAQRLALKHPEAASRIFDQLFFAPFAAQQSEMLRRQTLINLAMIAAPGARPDFSRCPQAFALNEPYPVWNRTTLMARYRCYVGAEDPRASEARDDVAEFEMNEMARYR